MSTVSQSHPSTWSSHKEDDMRVLVKLPRTGVEFEAPYDPEGLLEDLTEISTVLITSIAVIRGDLLMPEKDGFKCDGCERTFANKRGISQHRRQAKH